MWTVKNEGFLTSSALAFPPVHEFRIESMQISKNFLKKKHKGNVK